MPGNVNMEGTNRIESQSFQFSLREWSQESSTEGRVLVKGLDPESGGAEDASLVPWLSSLHLPLPLPAVSTCVEQGSLSGSGPGGRAGRWRRLLGEGR